MFPDSENEATNKQDNAYWLQKYRNRKTGFPPGTIAHYGPDNQAATKVVVGIFHSLNSRENEPDELKKWFASEGADTRTDQNIAAQIVEFLKAHNIERVSMIDGIFGCPHEEVLNYPEGKVCPQCHYWATHDRSSKHGRCTDLTDSRIALSSTAPTRA